MLTASSSWFLRIIFILNRGRNISFLCWFRYGKE
jgi:hypothetical protein